MITPPNPNAVFFSGFDDLDGGIFNGAQFESGLDLAHSGTLPGWEGSGQNDVH
ncbi:MAG: hypothetical protein GWO24_15350, partial [Akkermansiaceae bacterium]|nr:hypothetical protein [Akkermansiaceae bacterium]